MRSNYTPLEKIDFFAENFALSKRVVLIQSSSSVIFRITQEKTVYIENYALPFKNSFKIIISKMAQSMVDKLIIDQTPKW